MKIAKKKYWKVLLIFCVLCLSACASVSSNIKPDNISQLTIGKSTRDDVQNLFGLPFKINRITNELNDNIEMWIYMKDSAVKSSMVPIAAVAGASYVAVAFGSMNHDDKPNVAAIFAFNEESILIDAKKGEEP